MACPNCQTMSDNTLFLVNQLDAIGMWADERLSGQDRRTLMGMVCKLSTHVEAMALEVRRHQQASAPPSGGEMEGEGDCDDTDV